VTRMVDIRERTGWGALRDAFSLELPEGGVRSALAAVVEAVEMEPDGTRTRCSEGIRRFLAAIFGPSTTSAIAVARELGIVSSRLSSRFARAGLPSPKQYLALAKLVRAAFLGEAPGMTIRAISERLQVSSPQAYGRMVRQMTGMTGAEYRQAINGAAALARFMAAAITPHRDTLCGFDPLLMKPRGAEPATAGRAA
jgi:AraC-like DNA-binding protein